MKIKANLLKYKDPNTGSYSSIPVVVSGEDIANKQDKVDNALTTTDKTIVGSINELSREIVDLKDEEIPSYWEDHIDGVIAEVRNYHRFFGKDCFSFILMTDIHYPTNLGKISPLLAKKIADECDIKYVICAGDMQTRGCHATKWEVFSENELIKEMFEPIKDKLLMTEGNHDGSYGYLDKDGDGEYNNYDSNGNIKEASQRETYVYNLTPQELHESIYRKVGMVGNVHFDDTGTAYYVDDISNNVRYIGLNTQCNKYELQADGSSKYPKMWLMNFTQPQFDFLINKALVGLDDDTKVITFGHVPLWQEIGDRDVMIGVLNAFKNKTTYKGVYEGVASGGANYTNQIPISTDVDGNIYNGKGYKDGYRFNSSVVETTQTGSFITGFIPVKAGDTIYLNGNYIDASSSLAGSLRHLFYKSDKTTRISYGVMSGAEATGQHYSSFEVNADGYVTSFTINPSWTYVEDWSEVAYIRLNLLGSGEGCIVTVNEEIVDSTHGYDYVSVDCDFTEAKGKLVGYFCGHIHYDHHTTNKGFNIIATRCDGNEENDTTAHAQRKKGTTSEQSFDVFTISNDTIYVTKVGAGDNREISY